MGESRARRNLDPLTELAVCLALDSLRPRCHLSVGRTNRPCSRYWRSPPPAWWLWGRDLWVAAVHGADDVPPQATRKSIRKAKKAASKGRLMPLIRCMFPHRVRCCYRAKICGSLGEAVTRPTLFEPVPTRARLPEVFGKTGKFRATANPVFAGTHCRESADHGGRNPISLLARLR